MWIAGFVGFFLVVRVHLRPFRNKAACFALLAPRGRQWPDPSGEMNGIGEQKQNGRETRAFLPFLTTCTDFAVTHCTYNTQLPTLSHKNSQFLPNLSSQFLPLFNSCLRSAAGAAFMKNDMPSVSNIDSCQMLLLYAVADR